MSDTACALVETESCAESEAAEGDLSFEEYRPPEPPMEEKPLNMSPGAIKLRSWLNKSLRIQMFDGRVLVGMFLCTDRDANVILGSCTEFLPTEEREDEEPRMLGLVMVPGKHIQTVWINQEENNAVVAGGAVGWTPSFPKLESTSENLNKKALDELFQNIT